MKLNVYEYLNKFKELKTKTERVDFLRSNLDVEFHTVLQGTFHPNIQYHIKKPVRYIPREVPVGLSYQTMKHALSKVYLFVEGAASAPKTLTDQRREIILIQLLESMEPSEAEVFMNMLLKDLKIPYLTENLIREALPGLIPDSDEDTRTD